MSIEEKPYEPNITGRTPNFLYITENIMLSRENVDDIKSIVGEKFVMLEYFHNIKVAFLWTTDRLNDEELGKLNRLYGFYEVR